MHANESNQIKLLAFSDNNCVTIYFFYHMWRESYSEEKYFEKCEYHSVSADKLSYQKFQMTQIEKEWQFLFNFDATENYL